MACVCSLFQSSIHTWLAPPSLTPESTPFVQGSLAPDSMAENINPVTNFLRESIHQDSGDVHCINSSSSLTSSSPCTVLRGGQS